MTRAQQRRRFAPIGPSSAAARQGAVALLMVALLAAPALAEPTGPEQAARTAEAAVPAPDSYGDAVDALREGRRAQAVALLRDLVRRMPHHAGAWLDLGLTLCETGRGDDARSVFDHIEATFSPGDAIRELIAGQRAAGCRPRAPAAPPPRWELRVGAGLSDNVNQGISDLTVRYGPAGQSVPLTLTDDFRPRGAAFAALDLFHRRPLDAAGQWQWDSGLRIRQHDHLRGYDTALAFTGLLRRWQTGDWRGDVQASASMLSLGGSPYQQGAGAGLSAWRALKPGWFAGMEFEHTDYRYPDLLRYNNNIDSGSLRVRHVSGAWQTSVGAGWIADRGPERPGGDRAGPSASLQIQGRLLPDLGASLLLIWRRLDEREPYNPLLWEGASRAQRQAQLQIGLEQRLGATDALRFEFNHVDARDALPIFAWRGSSVSLTWIRAFGGG